MRRNRDVSVLLTAAIAIVRLWTRAYTWRMDPAQRAARRAEIESDLWEFAHDPGVTGNGTPAFQPLIRLLRGVPDDVVWRIEYDDFGDKLMRKTIALTATSALAVVFVASWAVSAFRAVAMPALPDVPRLATMDLSSIPKLASLSVGSSSFAPRARLVSQQVTAPERVVYPLDRIVPMMVGIDGTYTRVRSEGLTSRRPGQPVVVFESNLAVPLEGWNSVLPEVARFAPVVAYDRAGTGRSEWDSTPGTPEHVGARLRELLKTINAQPPYVLVGHVWGGALIRYFAGARPTDIAGLVYIDPIDLTQTTADEIAVYESAGYGAAERLAMFRELERIVEYEPPAIRAEQAVAVGLWESDLPARRLPAAPDVPTSVILSVSTASGGNPGRWRLPFDADRWWEAAQQERVKRLPSWVHQPGQFLMTNSRPGYFDRPDVLVDAIRRLVQVP